jgi:predicted glycoside hydrolase/deacetylase ChbG (UPF0249 family)
VTAVRNLIVDADDFGVTGGVNRGIVEAHAGGIVTSASLMVHGAAAEEAAALARRHPALAVGLHWDLDAGGAARVPLEDPVAVRAELAGQLERFEELLGRAPTHLDGHHHVHQRAEVAPIARELAGTIGVPLRGDGRIAYVGGFYGQWEWGVTDLQHVSVDFLCWILRVEVVAEWTEIGCHPGYVTPALESSYLDEREEEVRTLTDPRVGEQIDALGIRLASFADWPAGPAE